MLLVNRACFLLQAVASRASGSCWPLVRFCIRRREVFTPVVRKILCRLNGTIFSETEMRESKLNMLFNVNSDIDCQIDVKKIISVDLVV